MSRNILTAKGGTVDLSRPARTVVPTLAAEVLVALARSTMPMTGRQVHGLIPGAASQKGVWLVLRHLIDSGLVDNTPAGRATLYRLNREHVGADAVLALVDLRGKLFQRIRQHMNAWTIQPLAAAVFGSAARGDGNLESDIDLFVVRPAEIDGDESPWSDDVAALQHKVRCWSGNPCSLVQASPEQVQAMIEREEPIVTNLREDAVSLLDRDIFVSDFRKE
jgi:predicted nucleotidyltransferase